MVIAISARLDLDNGPLDGTKTALYRRNNPTEDLSYGTLTNDWTTYSLVVQGTISTLGDKLVRQGVLAVGDAIGILRYEYTTQSDDTAISPTLIPRTDDEIKLGQTWFRLQNLTPIISEDNAIICYEFSATPASTEMETYFPLGFPIQF